MLNPAFMVCGSQSPSVRLLLLLMLFAGFIYAQPPTTSLPRIWRFNQSDDRTIYRFTGESMLRTILLRESGKITFACGFYCDSDCDGQSYLFSVLIVQFYSPIGHVVDTFHKPELVWSANRNNPVTVDAVLAVTEEGDLVLKDFDEKITVWSAGTSGKPMGINLTDVGNLVLFDRDNSTVWQSFNHPTDTLLRWQKLMVGKKLVPSVSKTNFTEQNLFSFSLTSRGLFATVQSEPQMSYYENFAALSNTSYITMVNDTLVWCLNEKQGERNETLSRTPSGALAQYIRMEADGHLRAYGYDELKGFINMGDILPLTTCGYPTSCGQYGICLNGQCSCPSSSGGVTYYNPVKNWQPELGCSANVPLTCENLQNQDFLKIVQATYFNFKKDLAGVVDPRSCIDLCAKNCSCKAVFFRNAPNNDGGECFLASQVFSIRHLEDRDHMDRNDTVYLKVQNAPITSVGSHEPASNVPGMNGKKASSQIAQRVGLGVSIAFLVLVTVAFLIVRIKRNNANDQMENKQIKQLPGMPIRFSHAELQSITKDFSKKLGEGGFGTIFEGTLVEGTKVAVKCLDGSRKLEASFLNEVRTIGSIHHVNLVKLLGFCVERSHRMLVYEYMSNGSLDKWIFSESCGLDLDWPQKRDIIFDIAKALHYLHEECHHKIVHLDIKPQNVLLNESLRAKVSDFGLSKLVDGEDGQIVTTVRGTPGYLAPEWLKGLLTDKADVYSFGVVILEIICGRKVFDIRRDSEDHDLLHLFERKMAEGRITDLVKTMGQDETVADISRALRIAAWCLQSDFRERPSLSTVLKTLDGLVDVRDDLVFDFTRPVFYTNSRAGVARDTTTAMSPLVLSGPR